jgi:hypothetical protein
MAVPLRTSWKGSLKQRLGPVKALSVRSRAIVSRAIWPHTVVLRSVNYVEWTGRGNLRSPVLQGLVSGVAS